VVEKNPGTAEQNPTVYHIQKERQILEDLKGGDMTLLDLARSLVIPADELLAFSRVMGKMAATRKIYEKSIGKGLPTYFSLYAGAIPGAVIAKKNPRKKSDHLRDMERPTVLGHELDRRTLEPVKRYVDTKTKKDYGADPLGDNKYRMVPSGDIVDFDERTRRLQTSKHWAGYKKNPMDEEMATVGPIGRRLWKKWLKQQRFKYPQDAWMRDYKDSLTWFIQLYNSGREGHPIQYKPGGMPLSFEERQVVEAGEKRG
jgi:hypothetical protein